MQKYEKNAIWKLHQMEKTQKFIIFILKMSNKFNLIKI